MTTISESNIRQTLDLSSFDLTLPAVIVEYPSRSSFLNSAGTSSTESSATGAWSSKETLSYS